MGFLHIVLPVIVGGVIGYFTNYIAIKMMFRPRKAIYIGKHKLPFTPGIIPKNQKRIARAVGDAVSEQLLTKDAVLGRIEETCEKFISDLTDELGVSDKSIVELLPGKTSGEALVESASSSVARDIAKKAGEADIEFVIRDFGEEAINSVIAGKPMLAMLFNHDIKNAIYEKAGNALRDYINDRGEEKIKEFISDYIGDLSHKSLKEILGNDADRETLKTALNTAARDAFEKHGAEFLDHIDVKGIVIQKIEEMKPEELEELVLSVMKQELQAVINLGAVIGAIIGIINIFI